MFSENENITRVKMQLLLMLKLAKCLAKTVISKYKFE